MNARQAYQILLNDAHMASTANWLFCRKQGRATKLLKLRNAGYTSASIDMSSSVDDVLVLTSKNETRRLTMAELDALKFKGNKPVFVKIVDPKHEANLAVVRGGVCPVCGASLRRNLSLTGWYQCSQLGAETHRADPSKPSCNYQTFV